MIWKDVPGFEGCYEASTCGRIRNARTGRVLKTDKKINGAGYMNCYLGGKYCRDVHTIIALTFLGPKPTPKHTVNHKNFNRLDNSVENLEYMTQAENLKHSRDAGHWPINDYCGGASNPNAKLTEDDVRYIRGPGAKTPASALAKKFGVTRTTIYWIKWRKIWTKLDAELVDT